MSTLINRHAEDKLTDFVSDDSSHAEQLDATDGCIHVVSRMAVGGIETLVLDLADGDPDDTSIISLHGQKTALVDAWPRLANHKERLTALDKKTGFSAGFVWPLYQLFRAARPRAVYLHHLGPMIYAGPAAKLAGVPRILHVEHDIWHYRESPRARQMLAWSDRFVRAHHVGVSREISDWLEATLPDAPVSTIEPSVIVEHFNQSDKKTARQQLGLPTDAVLIGTAGRLEQVKGHRFLIEALARLDTHIHCAIAGGGSLSIELEALAERLGVRNRVHFLGSCDEIPLFLDCLDVFCLPSMNEGLPRAIMEAQAADLPVVATDVGSVAKALCPSTSKIVPAGDADCIANAVTALINACFDHKQVYPLSLRADLQGTARKFARANFDFALTRNAYRRLSEPTS